MLLLCFFYIPLFLFFGSKQALKSSIPWLMWSLLLIPCISCEATTNMFNFMNQLPLWSDCVMLKQTSCHSFVIPTKVHKNIDQFEPRY